MSAMAAPVVCTKCALHAESVFRVAGMDCAEEALILERRLTRASRSVSGSRRPMSTSVNRL